MKHLTCLRFFVNMSINVAYAVVMNLSIVDDTTITKQRLLENAVLLVSSLFLRFYIFSHCAKYQDDVVGF